MDDKLINILKYSTDPSKFIRDFLKLDVMDFHQEWLDLFESEERLCILAPRDTGKSFLITGYLIWKICQCPEIRILIVTMNQNKAEEMMTIIKTHLESNEKLIDMYGEQQSKNWSNSEIRIKNRGSGIIHKEPTLRVLGVNSSQISSHYDIIVLDDIVDSKTCLTRHKRQQIEDWYTSTLVPMLSPTGNLYNVGCLTGDSKVLMSDGTYRDIKDVLPWEHVVTYNDEGPKNNLVEAMIPQGKADIYEIETGYTKVKSTYNHPYLVLRDNKPQFIKLQDINIGDWIVTTTKYNTYEKKFNSLNLPDGFGIDKVKNITYVGEEDVYDLVVENDHNFIANGLVVHNTRWHADDFHNFLMNKNAYTTKVYKAIIDNEKKQVIWPERYSYEKYMSMKNDEMGNLSFEMAYQNNIIQTEDSPIKMEWVEHSKDTWNTLGGKPDDLKIYMGVDLASKTSDGDFFSVTVVGLDKERRFWALETLKDKVSMNRQLEIIKSFSYRLEPLWIGIEAGATQKIIVDQWKDDNKSLPIKELKPSWINDKWSRVQRLAVLLETNRLIINPELDTLCDELIGFPLGRHDDEVDSLAFAIQCVGGTGKSTNWDKVISVISSKKCDSGLFKVV